MALALVTGATSGIGAAVAESLARLGFDLLLIARRKELLLLKKSEFEKSYGVSVQFVKADLSNSEDLRGVCESDFSRVDVLVNSVGVGLGWGLVSQADAVPWRYMMETNTRSTIKITESVLASMRQRGRGHIFAIGSVSGRWAVQGEAAYCASKYFLASYCDHLREEIRESGIRVTQVSPGLVRSGFSAEWIYEGMEPLSPSDIADAVCWSLTAPLEMNVDEIVLFATDQSAVSMIHRRPGVSR